MSTAERLRAEVAARPHDVGAWYALATELHRAGEHRGAAEAWERVAALGPADHRATTLYDWGNALLNDGRPREAIERYRDALAAGFDGPGVLVNWAAAHARAHGRRASAGEDLVAVAAALELRRASAFEAVARWRATTVGDMAGAAAAFRRVIELDPDGDANGGGVVEACARASAHEHPGWPALDIAVAVHIGTADALLGRWAAADASPGYVVALLSQLGRAEEAEAFGVGAFDALDASHPDRAHLVAELAELELARGRAARALAWLADEGSDIRRTLLRARAHLLLAEDARALALVSAWDGAGANAAATVKVVAAIARRRLGQAFDAIALDLVRPKPPWFRALWGP